MRSKGVANSDIPVKVYVLLQGAQGEAINLFLSHQDNLDGSKMERMFTWAKLLLSNRFNSILYAKQSAFRQQERPGRLMEVRSMSQWQIKPVHTLTYGNGDMKFIPAE